VGVLRALWCAYMGYLITFAIFTAPPAVGAAGAHCRLV
jgi:hypothetical protein